jgi:hypothetical protein
MSCNLAYKNISENTVVFGYNCTSLESLIIDSDKLVKDLSGYCRDTNKEIQTTMLVTPFKDIFVFEIKVIKNEA